MKKLIWLSYNLGIRGDFEGMYAFLDANGAKECGDSLAAFSYEYDSDLVGSLTAELKQHVAFDKRARVYLIYRSDDGKLNGRFLIGKRKGAPWMGHAPTQGTEEDVDG